MTTIFDPAHLDKLVADTLPQNPAPGSKVVVGTVDQKGAQVVAAFKFTDKWTLQTAARHDWNGDNAVGAKVLLQW